MSTGSTLRLFLRRKTDIFPEDQYQRYLDTVERFNEPDFLGNPKEHMVYPAFIDINGYGDDGSQWVYNSLHDNLFLKPEIKYLSPVQCIGCTDFGSSFSVLVDTWDMSVDPSGSQRILTKDDISNLLAATNYLINPIRLDKNAKAIEDVVFAGNPYFHDLARILPSRYAEKEFRKESEYGELHDEEEGFQSSLKDISIMLNYYQLVSNDYEFQNSEFQLVYFKW